MPVFTNSQQVTLVLQSLLLGVGIGAVYDMLAGTASAFPVRMGRGGAAQDYAVLGNSCWRPYSSSG